MKAVESHGRNLLRDWQDELMFGHMVWAGWIWTCLRRDHRSPASQVEDVPSACWSRRPCSRSRCRGGRSCSYALLLLLLPQKTEAVLRTVAQMVNKWSQVVKKLVRSSSVPPSRLRASLTSCPTTLLSTSSPPLNCCFGSSWLFPPRLSRLLAASRIPLTKPPSHPSLHCPCPCHYWLPTFQLNSLKFTFLNWSCQLLLMSLW